MTTNAIILTLIQMLGELSLDLAIRKLSDRDALMALSKLLTEGQLAIMDELEPKVAAEARRLIAEEEVEMARESCVGSVQ